MLIKPLKVLYFKWSFKLHLQLDAPSCRLTFSRFNYKNSISFKVQVQIPEASALLKTATHSVIHAKSRSQSLKKEVSSTGFCCLKNSYRNCVAWGEVAF